MSKENRSVIPIYSLKLAGYLILNNFVMLSMADNNVRDDGRKVYFFNYSEDLQKHLDYYKNNKGKILDAIKHRKKIKEQI